MADPSRAEIPELSIIIPAFNESQGIQAVLCELCAESALEAAEIVVVDDGSIDDTYEQVRQYPRVLLIRPRVNMGYGASISHGVRACQGRYVVWFDADGQHKVQDLLVVVRTMISENLDYCIGVRDES